ncbi:MAG: hypothetical protein HY619_01155 [Thaumarchaeota archaeon]|nr:hypothetical protein [Nitrososphaerota archaeon]
MASETILKVGKKGEIFTSKELRAMAKIRKGGQVKAKVVDGKMIIETVPSIEDLLQNPVISIKVEEAEALSEEAQKEEEVYG